MANIGADRSISMQTLRLDDGNNLVIADKGLVVIDGADACAQDTKTRIGLVRGENPYDTTEGVDYYNELLGKMGGEAYIRADISKRIMANDEIIGIRRMTIDEDRETHVTTLTAEIATIYGDVQL